MLSNDSTPYIDRSIAFVIVFFSKIMSSLIISIFLLKQRILRSAASCRRVSGKNLLIGLVFCYPRASRFNGRNILQSLCGRGRLWLNQLYITLDAWVHFKFLLFIVSCVLRNGFNSLIHRASNVNRWTSPFDVEPRMSTLFCVMPSIHFSRCALTGPPRRCSLNRACSCRRVLPT